MELHATRSGRSDCPTAFPAVAPTIQSSKKIALANLRLARFILRQGSRPPENFVSEARENNLKIFRGQKMLKTPWKDYSLRNIKYHTDQELIPS